MRKKAAGLDRSRLSICRQRFYQCVPSAVFALLSWQADDHRQGHREHCTRLFDWLQNSHVSQLRCVSKCQRNDTMSNENP